MARLRADFRIEVRTDMERLRVRIREDVRAQLQDFLNQEAARRRRHEETKDEEEDPGTLKKRKRD